MRFRLIISPSRPMGSSRMLMVRAYPTTTHWTVDKVVWKWVSMLGSATLTAP